MNSKERIAECLKLQKFIGEYKPPVLTKNIKEFAHIPYISEYDIKFILSGKILLDNKLTPWYIVDAIKDWMKKNGIEFTGYKE